MRHLAEACNRASEAIVRQNETRRVLDEIDALLLPGGDYESVLDHVLTRVRASTMAHNVGLTLIDPVSGHGRLFAVSGTGGQPVSRVTLDGDMVATLSEAEQGLTVARCEEGRHSFLEPLQGAHDLEPGLRGDVVGGVAGLGSQDAEQSRLLDAPDRRDRFAVADLGRGDELLERATGHRRTEGTGRRTLR